MDIHFEHDYRNKVISQNFGEKTTFHKPADVLSWRSQWTQQLKSWHSPYKCIIDCSNISLDHEDAAITDAFESMLKFLNGFFLRKVTGFGYAQSQGHDGLPFEVVPTEEDAVRLLGIRDRVVIVPGDFRSSIQFENHFRQHVIEMTFIGDVIIDSSDKINSIKSKLTNNLMQWHSAWNLLVDCTNLEYDPAFKDEFNTVLASLKSLFLKKCVGYSPKSPKESYPFKAFRSRHKAVALLENEGMTSGDDGNCSTRKGVQMQ